MKRYYSSLLLAAAIAFTSCGDDDKNDPSFKFKNQDATGKINNAAFTYADGYADVDAEMIRITLTLEQAEDICDMGFAEGNTVSFDIDNEVKLTKLWFDLSTWEGNTVTLYQEEGSGNYIATEGAVEILSITETEVTGRIDARLDSESFINGNFSVQRCPK